MFLYKFIFFFYIFSIFFLILQAPSSADFNLGHYKKTEQLVGHCIFVIVATRTKYWEEQMKAYRMMIS